MLRVRFGVAIFSVALIASACSTASSAGPASAGAPTGSNAAAANAAPTADSGGQPTFVMPAGGDGTCTVSINGGVTKSWTAKQDMGTLQVSQWLSASSRSMLKVNPGDAWFSLNCQGDGISVSFITADGTTEAMFPVAPGDHVIAESGVMGASNPGELSALVNLGDKNLWRVSKPGTFSVTKFGGSRLAGTFSFSMTGDAGDATVTGSFDLSCTGDACS